MNRSLSADLIKALSIFGVVFIHGTGLLGTESDFQIYAANLFRFCVPCFITIWAYFFEMSYQKKEPNQRRKYIMDKFFHLFIVFALWSLMYFFISVDWNTVTLRDLVTKHFSGYGWSGQYFFIILFQLLLFYPVIRWIYLNKFAFRVSVITIIILYILEGYFYNLFPDMILKLSDRPFVFWIPYVFAGIALTKQKTKKLNPLFISTLLLIPIESLLMGFDRPSAYVTFSVLIASIILCLTILPMNINTTPVLDKIISHIGKNTMIIFVANPIVILLLDLAIPNDIFSNSIIWKIIESFLTTSLIISICLILNWIIEKIKLDGILK